MVQVVKALRDLGASLVALDDGNGMTALLALALCRKVTAVDIIDYLLSDCALLNEQPFPITAAFDNNNLPVASALLTTAVRKDPDNSYWVDNQEKSTLYYAAALGLGADVIKCILATRGPTHFEEGRDSKVVLAALKGGNLEALCTLLQAGAHVEGLFTAGVVDAKYDKAFSLALEERGCKGDLEGLRRLLTPEGLEAAGKVSARSLLSGP